MEKFVIICDSRTGSNLLCGMLNQHPHVACHYEAFNPDAIFMRTRKMKSDKKALEKRDADPIAFLETLYSETGNHRALGFKLFVSHDARALKYCMGAADIKKIILSRQNLLAQYSSKMIALKTQQWDSPQLIAPETGRKVAASRFASAQAKVVFRADNFLEYIEWISGLYESAERQMNSNSVDTVHRIEYSRLMAKDTAQGLFKFLNVHDFEINFPLFKKQNTSRILDRFENPDDVLEILGRLDKLEWAHENVKPWQVNKLKTLILNAKRRYWAARRR